MTSPTPLLPLDEALLDGLGFSCLSSADKTDLLRLLYDELEQRVGEKLTEGMPDSELEEFDAFTSMDLVRMARWFDQYMPDFQQRDDWRVLVLQNPGADPTSMLSLYGSQHWLFQHRPDTAQITKETYDKLLEELVAHKDELLQEILNR